MNVDFTLGEGSIELPPAAPKEMLSVSTEGSKTLVRINSSSLSIIQECMRKAQYSLEEGWRAESQSPATIFGSAVHRALEVFYRAPCEERELLPFEKYEQLAFGHPGTPGLVTSAIEGFVEKNMPLAALPETDKRSTQNGIWILWHYFKKFQDDPYIAHVDDKGPFVERGFTSRVYEDGELIIDLFGTIDFVFRDTQSGALIAGDHKTSSGLGFGGSSYFDREKPNHQYTAYMLGLNWALKLPVSNFMVNVVEVKAKPKTARGSAPSFPRQLTNRTEEDFAELVDVLVDSVRRYLEARKTGTWILGPVSACTQYGACQFKQVCASPSSLRQNILTAKFKKEN